ncbi:MULTISPECIES: phenylacetate--CoA ligase family protein [Prauserella salsuginis group]|uniref:Phenylacetate-CoA ligase n=2 Tax=Prauserella salsuginis group TaxID=2893672 RepID=A0A839XKX7_9PSEU|nr:MULTISPECIES: AMP-binding protein [Prauserella salsuginis group]MBB3661378.1 phenylacetate-CoA ligase [Prauserella sediminis]MCR3719300.1 phenylacetate-CoA ligase [Prauserella flava]MCR3735687.1 phenylacetate-CoA ligase [Prauserella salsuginis]
MEQWSWPPRYDESYQPDPAERFWFPRRETMPAEQRDEAILARIRQVMEYAWENAPFYRRKWDEAGIHPSSIKSLADFEKVPVVRKEELRADQAENEPFGSYLAVPTSEVKHVNGTSGTTGRPTAFGISERDWRSVANAHARVMWAMGIRPDDTVLVASPLSLYWGSWGAYIGAERLGARVFPFGAGTAGQTARTVRWMRQMGVTVFYGTPSYALHLAEVARDDGLDPASLGLRKLFFSGEPGASVPSIRSRIAEAFGAQVYDSGSMAEVSPWMHLGADSDEPGVLCWQDLVYTEVCDPTGLHRVDYGSEGTPVYTTLERTSQPMIRLLSGDLTRWEAPSADRGRTYPFLPRGIYGRIDDMFTVRGENVYPSAIDDVVMAAQGYGGEHRIVISRESTMDSLAVQVEYEDAMASSLESWAAGIADRLRTVLGVGAKVVPVRQQTFDRTEFKARRVVDDRDLLRRLEGAS